MFLVLPKIIFADNFGAVAAMNCSMASRALFFISFSNKKDFLSHINRHGIWGGGILVCISY